MRSELGTGPDGVEVREADLGDPGDQRALLDLLDAYAADPMGDSGGLPAATRRRLVPALADLPGALVLIARLRGEPVGIAVCFPGFSTFQARPLLNVHDLAVLPAHRGRGIGRRLLRAVEAEAVNRGCCKVTLEVREDNAAARRLYGREGFGAGSSGGEPIQYLFLEKRLGG
jgi:ribosomal protein S18 acetylase RimI-like enzyme